ncbi:MAG: S8 family serine peptidase [Longimicrobiaceae bacterium]
MKTPIAAVALMLVVGACGDVPDPLAPPTAPAPARSASTGARKIPGQYIVVFKDDVRDVPGLARRLAAAHGGKTLFIYESALKGFGLSIPDAAVAALARNPEVSYVEQNQVVGAGAVQTNAPWGLDRVDQRSLPLSTDFSYFRTGAGVRAYVLDSGIRMTHNEFGGRASTGYDFVDNDTDASDCNGHGTHVAATIGGATYGVAKGVSLVAVRILDCAGYGDVLRSIAAVDWVTAHAVKPAVANMSLWSPASSALDNAVRNSIASGVVYTIIAGNGTNNNNIPANACSFTLSGVTQAIVVGATTSADQEASFSNYGTCVDLLAPGVSILSAWNGSDSDSKYEDGTSMAAPHVAGAVAQYLEQFPTASPSTVASAITGNASTNKITLSSTSAGAGTPNRLLYTRFIGFTASYTGASQMGHGTTCTWNASVTGGASPYTYNWSFIPSTANTYMTLANAWTSSMSGTGMFYGSIYSYGTGTLYLTVTDASGTSVSSSRVITIRPSFSGCYS